MPLKDPEARRRYQQARYAADPERFKAQAAARREARRADVRRQARERYARDAEFREERREYLRAWRAENREKLAAYRDKRRARQAFVERVDRKVVFEMHGGRCGICGEFIAGAFHVDHVRPLSKGGRHAYINCQPAHPTCNLRKGSSWPTQT